MQPGARGWVRSVLVLGLAFAGGAAVRLWLVLTDNGIAWPDEVYQSLEPAHRLVFGYGLVAWEFVRGARPWAFPGGVAGLLWLAARVGLDAPAAYLLCVKLLFVAFSVLTAFFVDRLARRLGADPLSAAAGAAVWAGGSIFIYFAPRAMAENASALLVCAGMCELLPREQTLARRVLGAALLGVAVLLRLQNGLFCVAALAVLLARREWRALEGAAGAMALCALALGLLDRLTWGHWFHSAQEYLRFNLVEGKSAQWGVAGPAFYGAVLCRSMPWLCAVCVPLLVVAARRAPALILSAALFVAVHAVVPHKELRFLLPALPLLCAGAAVGASALRPFALRNAAVTALLVASLVSAAGHRRLTFHDLGQYDGPKGQQSAYDDFGPVNRLLQRAGRLDDLCGLKVEGVHLAWTGGYSHLHRRVPLYGANGPSRGAGVYNYVITPMPWARGTQPVIQDGNFALARLDTRECLPDPAFSWNLP